MDDLFTSNYGNDDATEREEINELLELLNGLKSEDEESFEEESVDAFEHILSEFDEEENIELEEISEDKDFVDILGEFENLEKLEDTKKASKIREKKVKGKDNKNKIKILDKVKGILFKVVDVEEEETNENQRILKELEKTTQKNEKKVKVLKDKQEKKEARKVKKASKDQSLKSLKKERKEKEPKEPEEKIRVTPVFLVLMLTIVASLVLVVVLGTNTAFYNRSLKNASEHLFNQQYELAYKEIVGLIPREEDEAIYSQIINIMALEKQYISYLNYMDIGMRPEALNSLLIGFSRYDDYKLKADDLGVSSDMELVLTKITSALLDDFGLSENDAKNLILITNPKEYTKELYLLLGYN